MRVAVYGGSFNPPHIAHAMVATWLVWTGVVDAVWFVPVYRHAFEAIQEKRLVDFQIRMLWCQQMVTVLNGARTKSFHVSDIESKLPVPSYSIDTLEALQTQFPEHQFRLVVGADVVSQLPQWKNWSQIDAQYAPIIVGRVGYEGQRQDMIFPNVSSTEIRRRVKAGAVPREWLFKEVADWMEANPNIFS